MKTNIHLTTLLLIIALFGNLSPFVFLLKTGEFTVENNANVIKCLGAPSVENCS